MTNKNLIELGFTALPHTTIGNSVIFDLGRHRQLCASSVGTCNEMLFITEINSSDPKEITAIVVLHNYDYDGQLPVEKVKSLIDLLKSDFKI